MFVPLLSLIAAFALPCIGSPSPNTNTPTRVNLRIEGLTDTIFEGSVVTRGHNITTPSGGEHECNGLNSNVYPTPGPTCLSALDDASGHQTKFQYDGTYDSTFDEYSITSIGTTTQTATQFWGILLDYKFTAVGGCEQEVKKDQDILWAFDAFNKNHFLKATGPKMARVGEPTVYTVVDGTTGHPMAGALIGGATTDSDGKATVTFHESGKQVLKAEEPNSIRSNAVETFVH